MDKCPAVPHRPCLCQKTIESSIHFLLCPPPCVTPSGLHRHSPDNWWLGVTKAFPSPRSWWAQVLLFRGLLSPFLSFKYWEELSCNESSSFWSSIPGTYFFGYQQQSWEGANLNTMRFMRLEVGGWDHWDAHNLLSSLQ